MKRSQAARYARWSAALALLLAIVTVAVYLHHGFVARLQKKGAPPAPPVNVERQSNGLTFSKVDGNRKIFTVEASKSTEFRNQDANLLEEVKITIFGKNGERHDTIHTRSCQYAKANGSIDCSGTVQIDLQSAAETELAKKRAGTETPVPTAHVETRNVRFDQGSGTARTDERVTFTSPAGSGEAIGGDDNYEEGTMKLLRDVKMTLIQTGGPKRTAGEEVHVTGASLDFTRDARMLHLFGPAHAQTRTSKLDAGEITLNLDVDYRAEKLFATAGAHGEKPQVVSSATSGPMKLSANGLTAWFDPDGLLKKLDAAGHVDGSRTAGTEDDEFTAGNASVDMWPEIGEPKQMNLNGNVIMKTTAKSGQERMLETDKVRMDFTGGKEGESSRPRHAETLAAGTIRWMDAQEVGKNNPAYTKL